jgi:hypothetical protein
MPASVNGTATRVTIDDFSEIDPLVVAKKDEGLIAVCQGDDHIIMTPTYVAQLYKFIFGELKPAELIPLPAPLDEQPLVA